MEVLVLVLEVTSRETAICDSVVCGSVALAVAIAVKVGVVMKVMPFVCLGWIDFSCLRSVCMEMG